MPYDAELSERVRRVLARRRGFVEKKMFGGVGFLLNGNMCVGVWREFLILRLGPKRGAAALTEPFVRPFDITGKAMTGWAMIEPEGMSEEEDLREWMQQAIAFVKTLPAKE